MKRYTKEHEWVELLGGTAKVGITDYAQRQLGDVVFVELPDLETTLALGDEAAVIESVKAAGEIHSPISGLVLRVNEQLEDQPELVNESPEADGWFYEVMPDNIESQLGELMDEQAYNDFVSSLE